MALMYLNKYYPFKSLETMLISKFPNCPISTINFYYFLPSDTKLIILDFQYQQIWVFNTILMNSSSNRKHIVGPIESIHYLEVQDTTSSCDITRW